jgi:hypothetical protein
MIVVYTPDGGEPQHYDASTLRVSEASILQRTVDMKWQEILEGLERDDLDAMRGIVWIIKKRSDPALRFGDFDPGVNEMVTRMDRREVEAWVGEVFTALDSQEDRDAFVQLVTKRAVDAAADPEHARSYIEGLLAKDPKADETPAHPQPEEIPGHASSPSPTSSEPDSPTSDSSATSSTSLPEMSTI